MKRILLTAVLTLPALFSIGCTGDGSTIQAEAPGQHGLAGKVDSSGKYTLFHATRFDVWGTPVEAEKVVTIDLQKDDRVGFEYVIPKDKQWNADTQSDVIAYAGGSFRRNLGPIRSMDDHYYWANPADWDSFWAARPGRVLARKATQN